MTSAQISVPSMRMFQPASCGNFSCPVELAAPSEKSPKSLLRHQGLPRSIQTSLHAIEPFLILDQELSCQFIHSRIVPLPGWRVPAAHTRDFSDRGGET